MACEFCVGVQKGHVFRALEHLDHCFVFIYFYNSAQLFGTVVHLELHNFIKGGIAYAFQYNQRSIDFAQAEIFYCHNRSSLCILFHDGIVEVVNSLHVIVNKFQLVIGNIIFDGYDLLKYILPAEHGHGHTHGDQASAAFV